MTNRVEFAQYAGKQSAIESRIAGAWPGINCEVVTFKQGAFAFRHSPTSTYLALHDFIQKDGEIWLDGRVKKLRHDVRDKLTYLPAGSSLEGWSEIGKPGGSSILVYLDDRELSPEHPLPDLSALYLLEPDVAAIIREFEKFFGGRLATTVSTRNVSRPPWLGTSTESPAGISMKTSEVG